MASKDLAGAVVLVVTLAAAGSAEAQDVATVAFASGATADWISTHENVKYFREGNPLLRWLDHKPKAMIALGAGMDVAGVYAWHRLMKNHPKWRKVGLYGAAAARAWISYRNVQIRRKYGP
jgi:hypothetical protein